MSIYLSVVEYVVDNKVKSDSLLRPIRYTFTVVEIGFSRFPRVK